MLSNGDLRVRFSTAGRVWILNPLAVRPTALYGPPPAAAAATASAAPARSTAAATATSGGSASSPARGSPPRPLTPGKGPLALPFSVSFVHLV